MQRNDLTDKLQNAVKKLRLIEVKLLLDQGADPSAFKNNTTALHLCMQNPASKSDKKNEIAILEMLLEKASDLNQLVDNRTIISLAAHKNAWEEVLLIAQTNKTDKDDSAHYGGALIDAIRFCNDDELLEQLVTVLCQAGALCNQISLSNGYTPLHWAVERNKPFAVHTLLAHFTDSYLNKGNTDILPIRLAFQLNHMECFSVIAEKAYMPIIKGERYATEELKHEKDMITHYVFNLPDDDFKFEALINGQREDHPLGQLNHRHRNKVDPREATTISQYADAEKRMREMGYPLSTMKSKPIAIQRSASIPIYPIARTPSWIMFDYLNNVDGNHRQPFGGYKVVKETDEPKETVTPYRK